MYLIDGTDYSEILPVVKLHELLEAWAVASRYFYPKEDSESVHFEAKVAELTYVEEIGLTDKYLKWIAALGVPQHYLDELRMAQETVIARKYSQHQ